jgi:hypothetical protein
MNVRDVGWRHQFGHYVQKRQASLVRRQLRQDAHPLVHSRVTGHRLLRPPSTSSIDHMITDLRELKDGIEARLTWDVERGNAVELFRRMTEDQLDLPLPTESLPRNLMAARPRFLDEMRRATPQTQALIGQIEELDRTIHGLRGTKLWRGCSVADTLQAHTLLRRGARMLRRHRHMVVEDRQRFHHRSLDGLYRLRGTTNPYNNLPSEVWMHVQTRQRPFGEQITASFPYPSPGRADREGRLVATLQKQFDAPQYKELFIKPESEAERSADALFLCAFLSVLGRVLPPQTKVHLWADAWQVEEDLRPLGFPIPPYTHGVATETMEAELGALRPICNRIWKAEGVDVTEDDPWVWLTRRPLPPDAT